MKRFLSFLTWMGGSLGLVSAVLVGLGYIVGSSKSYMLGLPGYTINQSETFVYTGIVFILSLVIDLFSYALKGPQVFIIILLLVLLLLRRSLLRKPIAWFERRQKSANFRITAIGVLILMQIVLLVQNLISLKTQEVSNLLFAKITNPEFSIRVDRYQTLSDEFGLSLWIFTFAVILLFLTIRGITKRNFTNQIASEVAKVFSVSLIVIHFLLVPIKYGFVKVSSNYPVVTNIIMEGDLFIETKSLSLIGEGDDHFYFFVTEWRSKDRKVLIIDKSDVSIIELTKKTNIFGNIQQKVN